VRVEVTRNTGETAQQKVNELLASLAFAIVTVVVLLAFTLGGAKPWWWPWPYRSAFPWPCSSISLFGYTINRVTLFALILSWAGGGRPHHQCGQHPAPHVQGKIRPIGHVLFAVNEVLPPVIMSTLAIIISFTPLFFITGMMGPYMAPMAANVPMTVIFSTLCALTIVPWMTYLLLKNAHPGAARIRSRTCRRCRQSRTHRVLPGYGRGGALSGSRRKRVRAAAAILILLIVPSALALFRLVPSKCCPLTTRTNFRSWSTCPKEPPWRCHRPVVRNSRITCARYPR
jgi:multidrug efflux pump subunit AcrB